MCASCWCIEACQAGNAPEAVAVPVCAVPESCRICHFLLCILSVQQLKHKICACRSTGSTPSRRPATSSSTSRSRHSRDRSAPRRRPARSPSSRTSRSRSRHGRNRLAPRRRPARSASGSRSCNSRDRSAPRRRPARSARSSPRRRSRDPSGPRRRSARSPSSSPRRRSNGSAARQRPARSASSSPRRRSRDRSAARRRPARRASSSSWRRSRNRSAPRRRPARSTSRSPRRRSRDRSAPRRRPASKGCRLQSRTRQRRFSSGWDAGPVGLGGCSRSPARRCPPQAVRGSPEYKPLSLGLVPGDQAWFSPGDSLAWPFIRSAALHLTARSNPSSVLTLSQVDSNTGCTLDCTFPTAVLACCSEQQP